MKNRTVPILAIFLFALMVNILLIQFHIRGLIREAARLTMVISFIFLILNFFKGKIERRKNV